MEVEDTHRGGTDLHDLSAACRWVAAAAIDGGGAYVPCLVGVVLTRVHLA